MRPPQSSATGRPGGGGAKRDPNPLPGTELSEVTRSARHEGGARTAGPRPPRRARAVLAREGRVLGALGPSRPASRWGDGCPGWGSRSVSRLTEMGPSPLLAGQTVLKEREEMTWANETLGETQGDGREPTFWTPGSHLGVQREAVLGAGESVHAQGSGALGWFGGSLPSVTFRGKSSGRQPGDPKRGRDWGTVRDAESGGSLHRASRSTLPGLHVASQTTAGQAQEGVRWVAKRSPARQGMRFPQTARALGPAEPARAQGLRITRLGQSGGPPDVVAWRIPFRARPSRGSSRSAWGKDPEGRAPACPARATSFPASPPRPVPQDRPHSSGDHPRRSSAVAGNCA